MFKYRDRNIEGKKSEKDIDVLLLKRKVISKVFSAQGLKLILALCVLLQCLQGGV
jgi:hypothetical protein